MKYYTPNINEFYVGFEFEMDAGTGWSKQIFPKPWWHDGGMGGINTLENCISGGNIRVMELNKDLILNEGFSEIRDGYLQKDNIMCLIHENGTIQIEERRKVKDEFIFYGYCRSVNEFRKIIKSITHV